MPQRRRRVAVRRRRRDASATTVGSPHSGYTPVLDGPHELELKVRHELLSEGRLHFASLVVHRIADGVCLEGVVEAEEDAPDVTGVARRVEGVDRVINRLVVRRAGRVPAKG